jgi:hypothetical protein
MSTPKNSEHRKPSPTKTKVSKPTKSAAKSPAAARLSRTRRPPELEVADWQAGLRRQFGREQNFGLKNLGGEPVFSDFRVSNPASGTHYRVAIRGQAPGQNFCSCPDFATNDLGTCKHIEFTLAKLQAKRGGKAALKNGFAPTYSEIWLDYAGQRQLAFSRWHRLPQPACCPRPKRCLMPMPTGRCARSNSASWSSFCRPRRLQAMNCAATTTRGSSSPKSATVNAATRRWSRPTPRALPTRP